VLGLSYFTCVFLLVRPFNWYHGLDPMTFEFDLFKNINLGHNLTLIWLVGGSAFIFHMCIPSGKTFHLIPWPRPSDLFINLGYNFWLVGGSAFIFHMCIPSGKTFHLIHDLDPLTFVLTYFSKTLTLVITFDW
jgi:hypothetical protein